MTRKRLRSSVRKTTEERSSGQSNYIANEDLPKYTPGPCRKALQENKVEITVPYLHRKDTFYKKWCRCEKEVFEELYKRLSRSRRRCNIFQAIANKLPRKTIGDCVQYYYLYKNITSLKPASKEKRKGTRKQKTK